MAGLQAWAQNECFPQSYERSVWSEDTGSIDEVYNVRIQAYPNPFDNEIIFEFESIKSQIIHAEIFDALGQSIAKNDFEISDGKNKIFWKNQNFAIISAGFYILELNAGISRFRTKILKTNR